MKHAQITFKNDTPFSLDFDDFYFNDKQGLEESRFIYSEAFEFNEKESFVVAELGFGIGLNFFLTLQRFLRAKKRPKRLFYVSLEGFYIEAEKLREIYQKLGFYKEFKENLEGFLRFYPKAKEGIYRFYFKDCFLDLVFSEASQGLKELDFKADVWFLDGFAPAKNEAMFDDFVIKEVARLSKIGTQICTFSASSTLQKRLKAYNFELELTKGFAKRQMIRAFFKGFEFTDTKAYFARAKNEFDEGKKKVAIIGGGIAGASLAYELSLRGFELSVFEKENSLASGASGNESGVLSSLILKKGVRLGEFSEFAFYEASRFYQKICHLKPSGAFEFAYNEAMKQRFKEQENNALFEFKDIKTAFLPEALCLNPKELVQDLFEKSGAKIYLNYEFTGFERVEEKFKLFFKDKQSLEFDYLIYAMGAEAKNFVHLDALFLSKVRGQVTHLKPILDNKSALSAKGYICPAKEHLQLIGASYDRLNEDKTPLPSDDEANLINVSEFLPQDKKVQICGSRVGFRSYSSDRFAIFGALYDENFYKKAYKSLLWSKNKPQILPENVPNLYLSIAHGSRGFASAIIAARCICALMCDEPLPLYKRLAYETHPARFLIRKLKKGL